MQQTTLLASFVVLALAPSALAQTAQSPLEVTPERMPSAVRNAGIYHLATGSWTRTGGQTAAFGPDIVYSNTAQSSYFSSAGGAGGFAPGSINIDEGGLPGTTNGNAFFGTPDRDTYRVNCVTIGYCDLGAAGSGGFDMRFYDEYTPCTFDQSPDDGFTVTGLPAAGGCWTVQIDLTGGNEVCLTADAGSWTNNATTDSFGWSWQYAGTDGAAGNNVGFLLAGNPAVTDPSWITGALPGDGSNTYYGQTLCPGIGSGYLTQDFWWLADPAGVSSNCYFFGGYSNNNGSCTGPSNPMASYFFEMAADTGECGDCACAADVYCLSNPNSTGVNGVLTASGSLVASLNNVRLDAIDLPRNVFGYFITSQMQGLVMNPNGSEGNLCLSGNLGRFVAPGQVKNSGTAGVITLDTNMGEWDLAAIPTAVGPYAALPGLTSNFQLWHRDMGQTATSNFTNAIAVIWQ